MCPGVLSVGVRGARWTQIDAIARTDMPWRMNEWEPRTGGGNIVKDLTGHGYDAQGVSSNPVMMDTKWL